MSKVHNKIVDLIYYFLSAYLIVKEQYERKAQITTDRSAFWFELKQFFIPKEWWSLAGSNRWAPALHAGGQRFDPA